MTAPLTPAPLRLEAGKRYVSEKGLVTEPLRMDLAGDFEEGASGEGIWSPDGAPYYPHLETAKKFGRLLHEYTPKEGIQPEGDVDGSEASPAGAAIVPMVNIERQVRKDAPEYSAYLKARFANGAGYTFEWDGHRWSYQHSSFDDAGEFDLIFRKAPAPSLPAEPSREMWMADSRPLLAEIASLSAEVTRLTQREKDLEAECEELETAGGDLQEALEAVKVWRGVGLGSIEHFEEIGEMFYRDTGFLRPGKSEPMEMYSEDREEGRAKSWTEWCIRKSQELNDQIAAALSTPVTQAPAPTQEGRQA